MARRESVSSTALDPTIRFASLEIDDKSYKLCYDFNAIAEAEKVAGCNLLQGMAAVLINGMSATQVRGLLYAAIRKAHPKMSIEECGKLVRVDTLQEIRDVLVVCYRESVPEEKRLQIFADPIDAEDAAA
jgi:hypothetical protein